MPVRAEVLAGETPYLRLARAEHEDSITNAVRDLDQRVDFAPAPVVASPVQAGTTEKFIDPYDGRRISWVHHLLGGKRIIIVIPIEIDTAAVAHQVEALIDTALSELEPPHD